MHYYIDIIQLGVEE